MSVKSQNNGNGYQNDRTRESILKMSKFLDKNIRVKFAGGREASGILKGYDALLNLVLDNTIEYPNDPHNLLKITQENRNLGLVVCRGSSILLICPNDGMESISNPFIQD